MRFYCINQALSGYTNTMARMQESKRIVETGNAEAGRVRQFWEARNMYVPQEYTDAKTDEAYPQADATPAIFTEEAKPLPEMLAYAAQFQTDDGMTAYIRRNAAKLPENDRRIAEDLLGRSPEEIRREIGRMR